MKNLLTSHRTFSSKVISQDTLPWSRLPIPLAEPSESSAQRRNKKATDGGIGKEGIKWRKKEDVLRK